MEWKDAIKTYRFNPSNIGYVLDLLGDLPTCYHQGKTCYNIPCAFDIETSSFYDRDLKTAIMYEWTFGINGFVIIGRTWEQFILMIRYISKRLSLDPKHTLVCFIHNAGYEFQFIRKLFTWHKVFSIEERKPIYMITEDGIEFRCSYLLSGYGLAKLADQLHTYKFKKLVGDLDYSLIRHSRTKLYDNEIAYCINDVRVVMAYIQEKLETEGKLCYMPLTKTGYVRNFVRNYCFNEYGKPKKKQHKKMRYMNLIKRLTIEPEEYLQLKRAFAGGYTHASVFFSGKTVPDVTSMDLTSAYPTVMCCEMFPMSKGKLIEIKSKKELLENLRDYCCLFDIHMEGVESKFLYDNYISESRCFNKKNVVVNNGRVMSADEIDLTVTEQDYLIISKTYKCKTLTISNFRRYMKDYLPKDFIKSVLKLYERKTTLKNVEGKEREYLAGKEMLNATYGCCVTDICRSDIIYDGEWSSREPNLQEVLDKYNNSNSRFLFYPWGVWVTSYNRRNLWTAILECGEDYLYSDTDSVKIRNFEKHKAYFDKYNKIITNQLEGMAEELHIPFEKLRPKTIKGEEKPLGLWDFDGNYKFFRCLGAKRYLVEYSQDERNGKNKGKISLTVAGLNKKSAVPYLQQKYGEDIFDHFNHALYIPKEATGKNTHTYIDDEREGMITDYQGTPYHYKEMSSVHLEPAEYSLKLSRDYRDLILDIQEGFYDE